MEEHCGYVTIVGKPNTGKSTLINKIIEKKISITSNKKNTTQKNIIGIRTKKMYQSIYIDTPGIKIYKKEEIKRLKTNNNLKIIRNSVLIIFVVDRTSWTIDDELVLNTIKKNHIPIITVINKIDKIKNKNTILPHINFLLKKINSIEIVPISAKKIENIVLLKKIVDSYLPKKNHIFPKNYTTTNSLSFSISEIIRQKLIFFLRDELPSIISVKTESIEKKINNILCIKAIIYVQYERQKKIVIGKNAKIIKKVSILSRLNIEKEINKKIHLLIWVKKVEK